MKKNNLFVDYEKNLEFENNGFALIDLLTDKKVHRLREIYSSHLTEEKEGLYVSLNKNTPTLNIEIHNKIIEIINESMFLVFKDFDYVINHFIVKTNENSSEFLLHQDWNIVDETDAQAAHVWIALQDTNQENGGLFLIQKSHNFFNNLRSGSLGIAFIKRDDIINRFLLSPKLKSGQAIVYKQALFHGSFANKSNKPRLITLSSIKQKNKDWVYFDKDQTNDNSVMKHKMDISLFLNNLTSFENGKKCDKMSDSSTLQNVYFDTHKINNEIFVHKLKSSF